MDMNSGGLISTAGGKTGHTHPASDLDALPLSTLTAAGDLTVGTGLAQSTVLPRGASGHALVSDDTAETGLAYEEVSKPGHTHDYAATDHVHGYGVPIGAIMPFAGASAPDGWLLCNGASVLIEQYPDLAAVCGTSFGTATAGYFKIPSMSGAFPRGNNGNGVGSTGGVSSVTLTTSNMPSHNHAGFSHTHTIGQHSHTITQHTHSIPTHGHTVSGSVSVDSGGASHTHSLSVSGSAASAGDHSHSGVADYQTLKNKNVDTKAGSDASRANLGALTSETTNTGGAHTHTVSASGTSGATTASHGHTTSHTISVQDAAAATTGQAGYNTENESLTVGSAGSAEVTGYAGSGSAFDTVPPYVMVNYIIKAL